MNRRPRRDWTAPDYTMLRRLHDQGKSDAEIGHIMGRHRNTIGKYRSRLGLPVVGKPGATRLEHTPEARARISEDNRRRWQDPARRANMLQNLRKGPLVAKAKRVAPPRGTPEFRLYRKIRESSGPSKAREAFRERREGAMIQPRPPGVKTPADNRRAQASGSRNGVAASSRLRRERKLKAELAIDFTKRAKVGK